MIKVILIVVHCLTQESLEVIFHPATDASAQNAPQKTAFLRFTEICLCLMQFKAVQSNNPSLGALTLGHKRHHNNNTNGTERRQLSTPVPTGSLPIANMDE